MHMSMLGLFAHCRLEQFEHQIFGAAMPCANLAKPQTQGLTAETVPWRDLQHN